MANDTAESEYRIDQLRKVTKLDVDYTSAFTKACRKAFPNKSN